ncbi:MAG TPA: sulfite exporter TauE/SafE family protein [Anaerolineaceae bacterium]|nr:sulfite exporter TauE/SafE family protein [Anaerolineaceae bacterium]
MTLQYLWLSIAAFFAAALSGAAGFGGALLLLPVLAGTVGTMQAVPLLTLVQLIGNLSRVGFGFKQIKWKPVGLFLVGAVPLCVAGALLFAELPKSIVNRCIGAAILFFTVLKLSGIIKLKPSNTLMVVGGGVVGLLSGLVGSAGPLGAFIFLNLGLTPVAYIASEATTALVMHGVKTVVYQSILTIDPKTWILAGMMGIAMIFGTWVSKRILEKLDARKFQIFVSILLIAMAGYMVIHG